MNVLNVFVGAGPSSKLYAKENSNFDPHIWSILCSKFGTGFTLHELLSVATVLQSTLNLPQITRNQKRSLPLLVNYFSENSAYIIPVLPYVSLYDENLFEISSVTEYNLNKRRPRTIKQ